MSENEIKPVAWRYSDLDEEVSFTDDPRWAEAYPDSHAPLYDQFAIDLLREDLAEIRSQRDRAELVVEARGTCIDRLTAERDAAVAELARLRAEVVAAHTGENIDGCGMTDAQIAAIDAARSEGGV